MEQQFTLTDYLAEQKRITPVTREVLEEQLDKLDLGNQFRLEAPVTVEGKELFAVNCVCRQENRYDIIFMMVVSPGDTTMDGYILQNRTREKTLEILAGFVLEGTAPDFRQGEWYPIRAIASTQEEAERMRSKEKLEAQGFGGNKSGKK